MCSGGGQATPLGLLVQEAEVSRLFHRLHAVGDAQFGEDMADMALDRLIGNYEVLSNLVVGCALCQQLQDFQFALTQRFLTFGLNHMKTRPSPLQRKAIIE
jgi:hypothetical protein